jgi:hypothetical protein
MRSIKLLHDTANKERRKSEDLRHEATKNRLKAVETIEDQPLSLQYTNEAQKNEEKAAQHDNTAMNLENEAIALEAKALELNRKKNEIQASSQAEIVKLDKEEKSLRGEI